MDAIQWIETSGAERLLITDNVNNGNRLVKRLNRKGKTVSNLTVSTSARIAKELLIHNFVSTGDFRRIREVADDVGAFILEGILRADPERYSFVPQASLCTSTAAEILSNLNLIRENQVTDVYRMSADPKVPQLNQLILDYEKRLAELGFYDRCRLLKAGLKILSGNTGLQAAGPVGLLFTDRVSVLEKRFLNAYAPEAVRLFIGKPTEETSWHFYKSYGIWNEAEYILEDIRARRIPFGQVRIVYTSQDYEPALQAAFGERRVPIRFTSGRPVSGKNSVRMLLSLIQWASNGYRYEDLKSVVLNPLFVIPVKDGEKPVNSSREFLKGIEDGIGWGLDRYKKFLKGTQKEIEEEKEEDKEERKQEEIEGEKEGGKKEGKEKKIFHTAEYLEFIKDVVSVFDGIREPVDTAVLFGAMIEFTKKYSRRTEDNRIVLPLLEKERKELAFMLPLDSLGETLTLLEDRLENMSADDREDSRAVAACRISGVEILDRPYIYVIGLADRHFGISLIESPVLNDQERLEYFDRSVGNVPLSEERAAKHLDRYAASLELSEIREIHMGYCCFDTVKQEELSPSALFLNMREKYGSGADTLPLVEYPRVVSEDTIVLYDSVWNQEPSGQDDEGSGTADDGTAIKEKDEEDDAENNAEDSNTDSSQKIRELSLQFSPSSLDTLLACPAKYNYQKNRRIPEEDYTQPDSSVWLGAADKGTYFHLILQEYVEAVFVGSETVSPEPDMDLFEKVFQEATEQTLELVPIESPAAARQDQEDVKEAAVRYLQRLHREFSDPACPWHVLACEKKFGRDGEPGLQQDCEYIYYAEPDSPETMQMVENHDLFHLTFTGIIDRLDGYVDAGGSQHFRIVDYKTGTRKNFQKFKMDGKKKHVTTQHSIYRMYAGQFGTVDTFEYHFPFEEEEEDQVYSISAFKDLMHDDDEYIPEVLHLLFVEGYYPSLEKTGDCKFCTYSDICLSRILKPEE